MSTGLMHKRVAILWRSLSKIYGSDQMCSFHIVNWVEFKSLHLEKIQEAVYNFNFNGKEHNYWAQWLSMILQ